MSVNPAAADVFKADGSKKLNEKEKQVFHTTVAQALFACERARPDMQPTVAALCARVKSPGKNDWSKLIGIVSDHCEILRCAICSVVLYNKTKRSCKRPAGGILHKSPNGPY